MKLSVIIICYNQLEYIQEAIESVLRQKMNDNYEIIIGDDGSDDGSYELIQEKYGNHPGIKIFQMNREAGIKHLPYVRQCQIRLRALEYVVGEYFAFLDGDDFFCDDLRFQKIIDILDKNKNISLCGSNFWYYLDGKYVRKGVSERLNTGEVSSKRYWKYYYIHTSTFVFRSSTISRLPYDLIEKEYNDNIITFCALQSGKMYYIDEPTFCYRQEVKNSIWTMGKTRDKHIRQVMEIDIANKINKKMWRESYYRYRGSVNYLLKNSVSEENMDLYNLAKELECRNALDLIDLNKRKKFGVLLKHYILYGFCHVSWLIRHILMQTRLEKYIK